MVTPLAIQVVVLDDKDSGHWIAQGLEYDICVEADSWYDALAEFKQGIAEQQILDKHFNQAFLGGAPPAPPDFASELFNSRRSIPVEQSAIDAIAPKKPSDEVNALVANLKLTVRVWT